MAIIKDDEEQSMVGGGVLAGNSGAKTAGAATTTGSGWTNLQSYLGANAGKGKDVANKITANTQAGVDKAAQEAAAWETGATDRVNGRTRQDLWSDKIKNDPTKVDSKEFGNWKTSANYSGPASAAMDEGYGQAYSGVQKAQNDVKLAGDVYGQQALAKQTFGKEGNYTTGQSLLDTFIARGDAAGKKAFADFQARNSGLSSQFDSRVGNVNKTIQGAGAKGGQVLSSVFDTIKGKRTSINAEAQQRADANTDKTAAYDKLVAEGGRKLSDELMAPYISRGKGYSADEEYTDYDLAALNALAGLDDGPGYKKGTDARYDADVNGYKRYLESGKSRSAPTEVDPLPVETPMPSNTPLPSANDPLPVPVPTGTPPPPSPTAPTPVPITTGTNTNPIMGNTTLGGYNHTVPKATRENTIDYSGPRPAGWPPSWPWPPPWAT